MASRWRAAESLTGMAARAGNWLGVRIGQSSAAVAGADADAQDGSGEGFQLAAGGAAVRWRGRSPAWTPATSIANTAVTAPDKNAAIANVTIAGGISLRRSGRLIWRPLRGLLRFPCT